MIKKTMSQAKTIIKVQTKAKPQLTQKTKKYC